MNPALSSTMKTDIRKSGATAIILAGGRASRMRGRDKAFLKIDKETLIKRQTRLLQKLFKRIIIVTNSPYKYRDMKGVNIISDDVPNLGPLGGIFSGLLASKDDYNFVIACDMPFINLDLIKYMRGQIKKGVEAVVPLVKDRYQPLYAFYSKKCLNLMEKQLKNGSLKIVDLFNRLKIKTIGLQDIEKLASIDKIFYNINTPRDFKKVNFINL